MKKQFLYLLGLLIIGLGACTPTEDWDDMYDDLVDAENESYALIADLEQAPDSYTLDDADYAYSSNSVVSTNLYFSSDATASEYLPEILYSLYFGEADQTIDVTYNYYNGELEYLDEIASVEAYELSDDDYDSMGEDYGEPGYYNNFAYNILPEDYLPDFLAGLYPSAADGDIVLVTYKYYSDYTTSTISEYWAYDGSDWAASEDGIELPDGVEMYTLTDDDYDSMGEDSGEPGKYNNFSSSAEPEDYLPAFLTATYPYAQEGDKIAVIYKYYASYVTSTLASEYEKTEDAWEENEQVSEVTSNFIFNLKTAESDGVSYNDYSESYWSINEATIYTMVADDYQTIVDYVETNIGSSYVDSYGTAEDYFGASAYYVEFRTGSSYYDSSFSSWEDAVSTAISTVTLPDLYPDSELNAEYKIYFSGYDGSMVTYSMNFTCTDTGVFEYVEGSLD